MAPSPQNFFKPLVPGFLQEFMIPEAFFKHHFDDSESSRSVVLKSASGKSWPVTMIGRRFADGWSKFAAAHDLDVGDFLVFGLRGDDIFDVAVFGSSACEKIIPPMDVEESHSMEDDHSSEDEYMAESDDEKLSEKSSEDSMASFKGTVTSINVLHIPKSFAELNDLNNRCCKMVLISGSGGSWPVKISCGRNGETSIRTGWHRFCLSNSLKVGDVFTFEMIDDGSYPIASIIIGKTADIEKTPKTKVPNQKHASESNENLSGGSEDNPPIFEGVNNSPTSLYIPKLFAEAHGLSNRTCEVALTAGGGKCWSVKMVCGKNGESLIRRGWPRFCHSNSLGIGDHFSFELIDNGANPIASILSEVSNSKLHNHLDLADTPKRDVTPPDTNFGYYIATIYSKNVKGSKLCVPKRFLEMHLLNNKSCPIVLKNAEGQSWHAFLSSQMCDNQVYIEQGWDKFRDSNGLKAGDIVMVMLIMKKPKLVFKIDRLVCFGPKPECETSGSPQFPKGCCVVAAPNPLRRGSELRFPVQFARLNKLKEELGKDCILRNEKGGLWRGTMKQVDKRTSLHVGCAWRRFAAANKIKQGDILMLNIHKEGGVLYVNVKTELSKAEIDAAVLHGAVPRGFRI